ncbi:putative NAD dependent epimerase/dehydratase [Aspergillus flavus]|uniref:NAD dependent epimerase/dehydratase n=1 Tax=Aspergillus flavus (strain ATCC 200026 / FGSC A1120 / IAM 13836 / NRRL 3357 / JCM 12722 / SRRC 167) TaxID=332952 RepID=A0A7G5JZH6_ASPFN|nr:uncharacterized protein G4B84_004278 [Aspergillus flavus NRRL3357]KAF7617514.1 hypothetical protein AFLA_006435 [Aspergillus flavus NRRL3357]QMW28943.1 hypothetical protein G4B84_004278 [Aspergillus flavus NRRL3357]QMW41018.1 hypothetical protein G4B11_004342 [Aspergillus flavus]QRD85197.1 putative NAD dependent epimerase/dehydratase [Aspergillus flavus]
MGQTASAPKPGTQIQVIGAGLPRTGTASFSAALTILLDGPVYHGGTQLTRGSPSELKSWIHILRAWLEDDKRTVLSIVKSRLEGYAAITDAPGCQLLPELLELYPDAKVICTVRDPLAWEKSMNQIHSFARLSFLKILLLPLPGMRHFVDFTWLLRQQWGNLYADGRRFSSVKEVSDTLPQRAIYSKHVAWLQENVPADRLVFFDVREGWEPLCKALGKDVPTDIPFPHVNDSEEIARTAKYHIRRALIRWVGIFAITGIAITGFMRRW